MTKKKAENFEVKTINNIDEIAKFYGIKKEQIKKALDSSIRVYDQRYIYHVDTIKLLKKLKVNYILDAQLTVVDDIQKQWLLEEREYSFLTIGIMGHINHGKTTLITKITGQSIVEDDGITQNIHIYKKNYLYLIDTPGHELFHRFREHIINIIDVLVLVVSLEDGIAHETKKIINMIIENNLNDFTVVVLTKQDIAKHSSEQIMEKIEQMGLINCKYIVFDNNKSADEQIKNLLRGFKQQNSSLYNYLVTIQSTSKTFNLVKIDFGVVNKKTVLLFSDDIYRVVGIYNLEFKPIVQAIAPCFIYVVVDKKMNINNTQFIQSDNVAQVENYNKYILGGRYKASFNKIENLSVYSKKKIVCIIEDIILYNIVLNLSRKHNLDQVLIIMFKSDKHIIQTIEPSQQTILFRVTDDKEIKAILQDKDCKFNTFTNIYQLDDYFAKNNLDIFNNTTIQNLAQVVKIFTINNKKIIGCQMLKGSFKMNQKVKIALSAQINSLDETNTIISMKQDTKFIKQTRKDIFFGIVFSNSNININENYYIYS